MLEAIGAWTAAYCHHMDDLDFPSGVSGGHEDAGDDVERGRKRQRRSIFLPGPADSDDSDADEPENVPLCQAAAALEYLRPESLQCQLVPATPYPADALSKGACILSPGFPRQSLSSPCLGNIPSFVAVHEEPNAGYRNYMEDRSATLAAGGVAYLGVYDGHGGVDASTFLQQHLLANIRARLQPGCDLHTALNAAYFETNAAFRATGSIQGSTATTVILERRRLIAANVGDSPAFVIKKSGEVYSVIQEHKIEGEEAARIAAHGAPIYRSAHGPAYMGTPDGTRWLNMSRAFGDFVYPAISCEPYVCSLDVSDGKYLVLGSDGLTEKWSVTEAAQYLTQLAASGASLTDMSRCLVERSLARGSTDNISCMVVDLEGWMLHADAAVLTAPTQVGIDSIGAAAARVAGVAASAADAVDDGEVVPPSPLLPPPAAEQRSPQECTPSGSRHQRQRWSCDLDAAGSGDAAPHDDLVCKETPLDEQQCRSPCRQVAAARASPLAAALASAAAEALNAGRSCRASPCTKAAQATTVAVTATAPTAPHVGVAVGEDQGPAGAGAALGSPGAEPVEGLADCVPEAKL